MTLPKTFTLPVSDCGSWLAGLITEESLKFPGDDKRPRYGIIVWYDGKDIAADAAEALVKAHLGNDAYGETGEKDG